MDFYLNEVRHENNAIKSMAPNEVRRLLYKTLTLDQWACQEK